MITGRWISEADDQAAPLVVVINDGMVRRHFPDEDPIGKRLNLGSSQEPRWREIVGVAAEARYFSIRGDSRDALYLPYAQAPTSSVVVTLSSSRDLGHSEVMRRGCSPTWTPRWQRVKCKRWTGITRELVAATDRIAETGSPVR